VKATLFFPCGHCVTGAIERPRVRRVFDKAEGPHPEEPVLCRDGNKPSAQEPAKEADGSIPLPGNALGNVGPTR